MAAQHLMGADLGQASGVVEFTAQVDGIQGPLDGSQGLLTVRLVRNGLTAAEIQAPAPIQAFWRVPLDAQVFAWHRLDVLDEAGRILAVTNPIFSGPAPTPGSPRFGDYIP